MTLDIYRGKSIFHYGKSLELIVYFFQFANPADAVKSSHKSSLSNATLACVDNIIRLLQPSDRNPTCC